MSAGVSEGYTILEHTYRVLAVLNDQIQFYKLPAGRDNYRLVLWTVMLHDMAKPVAVQEGNNNNQHKYVPLLVKKVLLDAGFSEPEAQIGFKLTENDILGEYVKKQVKQSAVIDDHIKRFKSIKLPGWNLKNLWALRTLFYSSDATSYPYVRNRFFTGQNLNGVKGPLTRIFDQNPIEPTDLQIVTRDGHLEAILQKEWVQRGCIPKSW